MDFFFVCQPSLVEIFSYAPRSIAAHHGLTAVGIENAHGEVGLGHRAVVNQHQSVGAYALVAVTPSHGCLGSIGNGMLYCIDIDIVVATTVHLGEGYLAHLIAGNR